MTAKTSATAIPELGLGAVARPPARTTPLSQGDHKLLADALDRVLHLGVTVNGNVSIGLANVDLLYLDLRLLLASVDTIFPDGQVPMAPVSPTLAPTGLVPPEPPTAAAPEAPPRPPQLPPGAAGGAVARSDAMPDGVPSADRAAGPTEPRTGDAGSPAHGLVRLVLTLVTLIHDLLERQALRRMSAGRLNDVQVEDLGVALMAQAEEIDRLRRQFGFTNKDLTLNLGLPDGLL